MKKLLLLIASYGMLEASMVFNCNEVYTKLPTGGITLEDKFTGIRTVGSSATVFDKTGTLGTFNFSGLQNGNIEYTNSSGSLVYNKQSIGRVSMPNGITLDDCTRIR